MFKEQISDKIPENTYQTRIYNLNSVKVTEKWLLF